MTHYKDQKTIRFTDFQQNRFRKVRVRVNGLVVREQSLLMVRLRSPVNQKRIWMPPGGGVLFGETLESALIREMEEETGLVIRPGALWYLHEVIAPGVHAVEFYYRCEEKGGQLQVGSDPEYSEGDQILEDVAFIPFSMLNRTECFPDYIRTEFAGDYANPGVSFPRFI